MESIRNCSNLAEIGEVMKQHLKNILLMTVIFCGFIVSLFCINLCVVAFCDLEFDDEILYPMLIITSVCGSIFILGYIGIIVWINIEDHKKYSWRQRDMALKPMFKVLIDMLGKRDAGMFIAICCDLLNECGKGVDTRTLRTLEITLNDCFSSKYDFEKDEVIK